ncbi:MAG: serine/threonine-protein kinase, partial [Thermoanaerobaculia bacterium]|nr:serine/threonine-protein kinase [Thermoanaerobaculia bacterium]
HPNVVRIYDLVSVNDFWFYTMELVEGVELMEHLALQEISGGHGDGVSFDQIRTRRWDSIYRTITSPGTVEVPVLPGWSMLSRRYLRNLRISMRQLASGIRAIHHVGFVHRDVKPANIVVTGDGRVVLLDFGLARPIRTAESNPVEHYASLAGTPGYMSPEQAARLPLSGASDWYSFGVVLFQALTGTLPFTGDLFEIIVAQQSEEVPRPSSIVSDTPADLDELCIRLLDRDMEMRPGGDEIVDALGGDSFAYWIPDFRAGGLRRGSRFVGRENELDRLHDSLADVLIRKTLIPVEIRGISGTGKTMLVNQFLDEARLVEDLMILFGRCYSSEEIPYNAFDQIFDGVARHLSVRTSVGTPGLSGLSRRFPVLALDEHSIPEEGEEIVEGLRRLLEHLSEISPVIAVIDEAERADEESLHLLDELLDQPPEGPLLLVIIHSGEESSRPLAKILENRRARTITLEELGTEELREWSESFIGPDRLGDDDLNRILEDTGGDAYLVEQVLIDLSREPGRDIPTVSAILDRKLKRLPKAAIRLLKALAEADRPLDPSQALSESGLQQTEEDLITILRNERLARSRFVGETEQIEIYHERVREWVIDRA